MTKKLKRKLIRIVLCLLAYISALLITKYAIGRENGLIYYGIYVAVYIAIGYDVISKAIKKVIRGKPMDENFLMVIASVGAFFISECSEAVAVMLFYQIGEWFQSYAVGKSRNSIKSLMEIRPDYAVVLRNGEEQTVDPTEIEIGEKIVIRPGEKVPLDGIVSEGFTSLDTKALTGESLPRSVSEGEMIYSGCINQTGVITVTVTKTFGESTVAKILELVENATDKKAKTENFITKFARFYTPSIVCMATAICVIPTVFFHGDFVQWLYRGLSFLVISCPCALVISIPLGFFGGIGGAGKAGILVKGSSYLERLAKIDTVVMDKTGTLTKGVFEVKRIISASGLHNANEKHRILELAALAENYSVHPIAESLRSAYGTEVDTNRIENAKEVAGCGVIATVDGKQLYVGNIKLMQSILREDETEKAEISVKEEFGTMCHVAYDGVYQGCIVIDDKIKDDSHKCIEGLRKFGIKNIIMLTGDKEATAKHVAKELGIDYYAELLPTDKVNIIDKLMLTNFAFVGDGINDAPIIKRADVGIAMGGLGADAAIEAADVVIMNDEPSKIALAMKISRRTLRIVKENIVFALGVKALILILATFGIATMWAAVFADVGVAFIAILNSMRGLSHRGLSVGVH